VIGLCLTSLRTGRFPSARITLAESTLRASEGPFCQERTRAIFHVGKEATVGQLPSCFGETNPTDNDAFRNRTQLPQTKPIGKS
jgi:hypothetical protein